MDNIKLENIIDQTLTAANDIVSTDGWGSLEEISALSDLLNAAKIANDLMTSKGSSANVEFEGGQTMPGFNAHVMPL